MTKLPVTHQYLRKVHLFTSLTEIQLNLLMRTMHYINLDETNILFLHGDLAERFFIVQQGHIKLTRTSVEGVEKVIEVIPPGESFAEAIMFMNKPSYPVTAQAIGETTVLAFENQVFLGILQDSFDTCLQVMSDMSMRLHRWLNEIDELALQNANYRFINYLLSQVPIGSQGSCQIQFDVPKQVIASRLSIKPETLSRILRQMTKAKILTVTGKCIDILDIDKLRTYQ